MRVSFDSVVIIIMCVDGWEGALLELQDQVEREEEKTRREEALRYLSDLLKVTTTTR
jgi:hypothetical protein